MPDEMEVETRELQETIEEFREERAEEKRELSWVRWIALSTALLAALAAVSALLSGNLVNEALMRKNDSVLRQAQASDQWSYYQAKGIKRNSAQQTSDLLSATPSLAKLAQRYHTDADRYQREQDDIALQAKKLEDERDKLAGESNRLLEHHHFFAYCVTFTQVAIALSAIAVLIRRKPIWLISLLIGALGLGCFIFGMLK